MINKNLVSLIFLLPGICFAQYEFSGYTDMEARDGSVYLSVVDDYRKISGVFPEQILNRAKPDSTGYFSFSGTNLSEENLIYRVHVDTCTEADRNTTHFNGHCANSKEIIFIANNNDTLQFPLAFDDEMFCEVVSKNDRAKIFLRIDSLKNDMRYAFGTYPSEASRKSNAKKWFRTLQEFGKNLNEPLAELYIYNFLSTRSNELHSYYLEDLGSNSYYDDLLERLKKQYPNASYTKQYAAELGSDKYVIEKLNTNAIPWWVYLLGVVSLISIVFNFYLQKNLKKAETSRLGDTATLSGQEKKVLDLILADKTNKEIATGMFVSVSTVKSHINNLYKKLNVSSREEVKDLYN